MMTSGMDSAVDELWDTIMQTCPILMKEWLNCFAGQGEEAKCEISATLTDRDRWTGRCENFLLRLVSDDKTGYRDSNGTYKPRVQLALAFVRHMSRSTEFTDFVLATLNARGREENLEVGDGDVQDGGSRTDHPELGIGLVNLGGQEERRGNGVLHEAAKSGQCADLEQFLSETNIDAPNNIGETALHLAAEFEHPKDVAILLRAGATMQVTTHVLLYTLCFKKQFTPRTFMITV